MPKEESQQDGCETFVGSGNEGEASASSLSSHESHASLLTNIDMQAPLHRLPPASKEPVGTPSNLSAMEEPDTEPKLGPEARSFHRDANPSMFGAGMIVLRWNFKSELCKTLQVQNVLLEALAEYAKTSASKIDPEQPVATNKYVYAYATFRDDSEGDFKKVLRLTEELMEKHEIANWDVVAFHERKLPSKFHVTMTLEKTWAVKNTLCKCNLLQAPTPPRSPSPGSWLATLLPRNMKNWQAARFICKHTVKREGGWKQQEMVGGDGGVAMEGGSGGDTEEKEMLLCLP
ncbi:hypothetical protein PAMP_013669 [Pampus punctatissimus]